MRIPLTTQSEVEKSGSDSWCQSGPVGSGEIDGVS
jgi:hypothetical protein